MGENFFNQAREEQARMSERTIHQELRERIEAYLARRQNYTLDVLSAQTGITQSVLRHFYYDRLTIGPRQQEALIAFLHLTPSQVPSVDALRSKVREWLCKARLHTLEGLAGKANVNRATIWQIMTNDKAIPNPATIALVVRALGLPIEEEERLLNLRQSQRTTEQQAIVRPPESGELRPVPSAIRRQMNAMQEEAAQYSLKSSGRWRS
jgi:transcriptional regulator with XRE-family HTH domain